MKSHKDLEVWRKSVRAAAKVYDVSREFPAEERYGLGNQMKRSSISIASNIAEGAARQTRKEFVQFLHIALGSASELDTQIEISKLVFMDSPLDGELDKLQVEINDISKMIYGLIKSVKRGLE